MKWMRIEPGSRILNGSKEGDYLFYADAASTQWEELVGNLYIISYIDAVAINATNVCNGQQKVQTRRYYESGQWYYLPAVVEVDLHG